MGHDTRVVCGLEIEVPRAVQRICLEAIDCAGAKVRNYNRGHGGGVPVTGAPRLDLDGGPIHRRQTKSAPGRSSAELPNLNFRSRIAYSSWLNQVELWFDKIKRDGWARGIFISVNVLRWIPLRAEPADGKP